MMPMPPLKAFAMSSSNAERQTGSTHTRQAGIAATPISVLRLGVIDIFAASSSMSSGSPLQLQTTWSGPLGLHCLHRAVRELESVKRGRRGGADFAVFIFMA
jgi:hypothetical protein